MSDPTPSVSPSAAATDEGPRVPLPRWKKVLLSVAGVLVAGGLALIPFESGAREELARTQSAGQGATLSGQEGGPGGQLAPGDPSAGAQSMPGATAGDPTLSPALMKMGFSFFVAFAVGLAFRSFLKLALIFVGLQLLALFGLSYVDWVTVNWETMSTTFDRFVANVGDEAESFRTFVTGSLPQAGLAALGLVAGFKR